MILKKVNKKGQVQIQINWIFVLIVGAIILIFFVSIIVKQKTVSDTKYSIKIREGLDAIFTSSQVATGTASEVTLPQINVEFDCNSYYIGDFDTGISKSLRESRVIFVPARLQGKKLITWSLAWDYPYKISDILYITSSEVRYILAYDSSRETFAKDIYNALPENINKELKDLSGAGVANIVNQNNYNVRYIFFTADPPSCTTTDPKFCIHTTMIHPHTEVSALHVQSVSSNRGKITFYSFDTSAEDFIMQPSGTTNYVDYNPSGSITKHYPTLYGAIFADDVELYNCMLTKAFRRHKFITSIYLARVTRMIDEPSAEMESLGCSFIYPDPETTLTELLAAVSNSGCSQSFNHDQCKPDVTNMEEHNDDLQINSCPLVY